MAEKKKRSRAGIAACIGLSVFALTAFYSVAAERPYRIAADSEYESRERFAEEMLSEEKAWIMLNRGESGEIYLNRTKESAAGDVNPYFACQAAMGLLAGEPTKDEMDAVAEYLNWHTKTLLAEKGMITNHRRGKNELRSTGKRDSVDSYVALYLTLLSEYEKKGGNVDRIENADAAVWLCAGTLRGLIKDGLTQVSSENDTRYLMDNAEVLEACRATARMLEKRGYKKLCGEYLGLAETVEKGIRQKLWQPKSGTYLVGLHAGEKTIEFSGWDKFYPDALVQIYPAVCGLTDEDAEEDAALYASFCRAFRWEEMDLGDAEFPWACVSYAALKQGDYERAEKYLERFKERYGEDRAYPFHTAESGWAARTCAGLLEHYRSGRKKGPLGTVIDMIRGSVYG